MTVVSAVAVPIPRQGEADAGPEPEAPSGQRWFAAAQAAAVLGLLAGWALPFTHAAGGRDEHPLRWMTVLVALAVVMVRPWGVVSTRCLGLAAAMSAGALAVCALSPGGWGGADVAAGYVLAAASTVVVLAWLRGGGQLRRDLVLLVVLIAGIDQAGRALLAWVRNGDPAMSLSGTFYWHNPFAAFLLPIALIALAVALFSRSSVRFVAWLAAPLCMAAIAFSSSRATLACAVVGWVMIGSLAIFRPRWDRRRAARCVAVTALVLGAVFALSGPPFFAHRSSPLAAADARAAGGETIAANSGYRVQFWHEAVDVAVHHPVAGAGYRTLGTASVAYTPAGWARSPWAHNGYLQALSDGGLLLVVPFLAACALAGIAGLRRVGRGVRRDAAEGDGPFEAALGVALLAALAHSAVDFDWSHPAILVEAGLLLALVAGPARDTARSSRRTLSVMVTVALIVATATSAVALQARIRTDSDIGAAQRLPTASRTLALAAAGSSFWAGQQPWRILLNLALPKTPGAGLQAPEGAVRGAIAGTAAQARIEPQLAAERAEAMALVGDVAGARAELARIERLIETNTGVGVMGVPALAAAGERAQALHVGVHDLTALASSRDPHVWQVVTALRAADGDSPLVRCAQIAAATVAPDPAGLPTPVAPPGASCVAVLAAEGA